MGDWLEGETHCCRDRSRRLASRGTKRLFHDAARDLETTTIGRDDLYLGVSRHDVRTTRRRRRANSNWPPFEFAAGLHLGDGYRATPALPSPSPLLPHFPHQLALEPPTPFSSPLDAVPRRYGKRAYPSPPKQVDFPPSRAFQSVFCRLEVCVVTPFSVFLSFCEQRGTEKNRGIERIYKVSSSKLTFALYASLSRRSFSPSSPLPFPPYPTPPLRLRFSRVSNRFALAPLSYCATRASLPLPFLSLPIMKYLHVNVGHVSGRANNVSRAKTCG